MPRYLTGTDTRMGYIRMIAFDEDAVAIDETRISASQHYKSGIFAFGLRVTFHVRKSEKREFIHRL